MTKKTLLLIGLLAALSLPGAAWSECGEARAMAAEAAATFKEYPRRALESLEKAARMCPGDYAIQYNLGVACYLSRKPAQAYGVWTQLAQTTAADSRLLVNLGWLALELGKVDEAEDWRARAAAHNLSDPNAVALHVEILFAKNEPKKALDIAAINKGSVPFNISKTHLEKVTEGIWQMYKDGNRSEAAAQMKDAIRDYPEIKKLQRARDLMRAVFFDKKVDMPEGVE